jgi:hypothetical protein
MKTKLALSFTLLLLLAFHASSTVAAVKSSCLMCHTSDTIMKGLYKPPSMSASEGEG